MYLIVYFFNVNRDACFLAVGQVSKKSISFTKNKSTEHRSQSNQLESRSEKFSQIVDRSRKRTESDFSNDDPPINAAREYKSTMKALRHGNKAKIAEPSVSVPPDRHISELSFLQVFVKHTRIYLI